MGYILFLIIATWVAVFYLYCKFKEMSDKVDAGNAMFNNFSSECMLVITKAKEVDVIKNLLHSYEAKFDYHHSVISGNCGVIETMQQTINAHEKKILTLEKKVKKPKAKKEKAIPKVVSKT